MTALPEDEEFLVYSSILAKALQIANDAPSKLKASRAVLKYIRSVSHSDLDYDIIHAGSAIEKKSLMALMMVKVEGFSLPYAARRVHRLACLYGDQELMESESLF